MAYSQDGFFGKFSGKLANLVVYQRNGQTVVRSRTAKKRPPAGAAEQGSRDNFARVMKLMQVLKPAVRMGFQDVAAGNSSFHKALSVNLKQLVQADDPKGYSWLVTSQGHRAGANDLAIRVDGSQATLSWGAPIAGKPWSAQDNVMLLALNTTTLETNGSLTAGQRSQQQIVFKLPRAGEGQQLLVFVSFCDLAGMAIGHDEKNMSGSQMIIL